MSEVNFDIMSKKNLLYEGKRNNEELSYKITLGGLFRQSVLKRISHNLGSEWNDLQSEHEGNNQHLLLRYLLPPEYCILKNNTDFTKQTASSMSKFFNYSKKYGSALARGTYQQIRDRILRDARSTQSFYKNLPLFQYMESKLKSMFRGFSETELKQYAGDLDTLIQLFTDHPVLKHYTKPLKNEDIFTKLTVMVLLALTWSCWDIGRDMTEFEQKTMTGERDQLKKEAEDLADIILPACSPKNTSSPDEEWVAQNIQKRLDQVRNLYQECLYNYNQQNYAECIKAANQILTSHFVDDQTYGEVAYLLALCCLEQECSLENLSKSDGERLMRMAAMDYAHEGAIKWLRKHDRQVRHGLLRPDEEGMDYIDIDRIVLNTTNLFAEELIQSLPEERKHGEDKITILSASGKEKLWETLKENITTRYCLLDEVPEKNLQDFLYILDYISANISMSTSCQSDINERWGGLSIFLRVPEDSYSALVDTAMKRVGNVTLKIYLLDDEKWAAQNLLFHYPPYAKIKDFGSNHLSRRETRLHFTVIGDGNHELTLRLLREAYWMGCYAYPGIALHLHVIAPNVESIQSELHLKYPNLFSVLPDAAYVSSVSLEALNLSVPSMKHEEVRHRVEFLEQQPNSFHYYVVNLGDDVQNINFGRDLREWTIQNHVSGRKTLTSNAFSSIACYCRNADMAYLAQHMVVQNVNQGNKWFNNYGIIPFGMIRDRYSWDKIEGGYLEKMAESTHLEYCDADASLSSVERDRALQEYYARNYNHDSSMAVALSLPTRLFHIPDQRTASEKAHLILDTLQISENHEVMMPEYANIFRQFINNSANQEYVDRLLYYEHSRWIRWMYSRGWKSASPEDVLYFMKKGNPRQQLYIARLHGCLCSVEELKVLAKTMCDNLADSYDDEDESENLSAIHPKREWRRYAGAAVPIYGEEEEQDENGMMKVKKYISGYRYDPIDFLRIDSKNIAATGDLLETIWFRSLEYERTDEKDKHLELQ